MRRQPDPVGLADGLRAARADDLPSFEGSLTLTFKLRQPAGRQGKRSGGAIARRYHHERRDERGWRRSACGISTCPQLLRSGTRSRQPIAITQPWTGQHEMTRSRWWRMEGVQSATSGRAQTALRGTTFLDAGQHGVAEFRFDLIGSTEMEFTLKLLTAAPVASPPIWRRMCCCACCRPSSSPAPWWR